MRNGGDEEEGGNRAEPAIQTGRARATIMALGPGGGLN